jgi:hypothetical protein
MRLRVLIGCEFSGVVRDSFAALGHDAWSCDLLPTDNPGNHIQGNVLEVINDGWDLAVFHPPCQYLTNSGVRWLYNADGTRNEQRWSDMHDAAMFFNALLNAPIERIAVENPIMHGHAKALITRPYTQIVQPYMFGHGETKATCLWLKNLPKLTPTDIVSGRVPRIHFLPQSPDRWKLRSTTYQGIADAMSLQWGGEEITPHQTPMFMDAC